MDLAVVLYAFCLVVTGIFRGCLVADQLVAGLMPFKLINKPAPRLAHIRAHEQTYADLFAVL